MKKLSPTLLSIADLLSDGQFHDGTTIGEKLNISRAAVWKMTKKLNNHGIAVDSVKGKGYRLAEPLALLDAAKINKQIKERPVKLEVFEEIDSTNTYLRSQINLNNKPLVCIAEIQTSGKGRFQRDWHSPFGKNIYLSLLYPFKKDMSELTGLSLVTAISTCKMIDAICKPPEATKIKWPNDIIYNNKKLAGILLELQAENHSVCHAIIGIGINVNMLDDKEKNINQNWTSLKQVTGQTFDRNTLCAALINQLLNDIARFNKLGLKDFLEEWEMRDHLLKKDIQLQSNKEKHQGKGAGINEHGHLLLKENNTTKSFSSGDTTLIK